MSLRLVIVTALEALEASDQRLAADILLAALDEDGERRERVWCPACTASFEWPGQLDAHRDLWCPAIFADRQRAA